MKRPHRRQFLRLAAGAAALPAVPHIARAQAYPSRPVRFVVGFAPGGGGDLATRLMAQWLSDRLGRQFVVENRVGASSNLATEQVVRAPADGYTLIQLNVANAINASLYSKLSFDVLRDLAPVASFMRVPNVMEVSPTLPVTTVPEFIAYAKANPGKVLFASSGVGTTIHMSGELFKTMAAIDIVHVPYRGLAAGGYADLMTGTVHVTFDNLPPSIELIRAGKLRALAVTSTTRSQAMPELPTVGDFLPGYEASAWYGIAELADEEPRRVDRPRHGGAALGNALEAGLAVVRLVAHQHDQPMTLALCLGKRALDQGIADAALAKRRLDGKRAEQQRLGLADANRRQPHRADQQRADARGERQVEAVAYALAQPISRLGVAAGAEGALVQALDRHRVVGRFRPDGEGEVDHLRPSALSIWQAQGPLPGAQPV